MFELLHARVRPGVHVRFLLLGVIAVSSAFGIPSPSIVRIKSLLSIDRVTPGSDLLLAAIVELSDGYHIQSYKPSEEFYTPTTLQLSPIEGFKIGDILYPKPKEKKFAFSRNALAVYEGKVVFGIPLTVEKTARLGKRRIIGRLRYQACNDTVCLRPQEEPFETVIDVVPPGTSIKPTNTNIFSGPPFSDRRKTNP